MIFMIGTLYYINKLFRNEKKKKNVKIKNK